MKKEEERLKAEIKALLRSQGALNTTKVPLSWNVQ
jgi:hypothetical protein